MRSGCHQYLQSADGIFCANYFAMCSSFAPCEGAWCGPCYIPLGIRDFPVRQKLDDDGEVLEEADEATRFMVARAGDHMMVPFHCDLCHFRNIMLRDPEAESRTDWEILDMIRRANLNAFWSQEKSSVGASLREAVRMENDETAWNALHHSSYGSLATQRCFGDEGSIGRVG
jgi:hypothetical protein